jgi:hypothetical protein
VGREKERGASQSIGLSLENAQPAPFSRRMENAVHRDFCKIPAPSASPIQKSKLKNQKCFPLR